MCLKVVDYAIYWIITLQIDIIFWNAVKRFVDEKTWESNGEQIDEWQQNFAKIIEVSTDKNDDYQNTKARLFSYSKLFFFIGAHSFDLCIDKTNKITAALM